MYPFSEAVSFCLDPEKLQRYGPRSGSVKKKQERLNLDPYPGSHSRDNISEPVKLNCTWLHKNIEDQMSQSNKKCRDSNLSNFTLCTHFNNKVDTILYKGWSGFLGNLFVVVHAWPQNHWDLFSLFISEPTIDEAFNGGKLDRLLQYYPPRFFLYYSELHGLP